MNLYTIGFTQKSSENFFELLKRNKIELLLDVRLNNKSQLAGFTKGSDLKYFLSEICKCEYQHCLEYAPTKDILDGYKKKNISWDEYVKMYTVLIIKRGDYKSFTTKFSAFRNICLLCSEPTAAQCHRRLAAEIIAESNPQVVVKHI
ncbi:MAG: DUF488 domain-containing protein [Anaerovoracaceae bacterium]